MTNVDCRSFRIRRIKHFPFRYRSLYYGFRDRGSLNTGVRILFINSKLYWGLNPFTLTGTGAKHAGPFILDPPSIVSPSTRSYGIKGLSTDWHSTLDPPSILKNRGQSDWHSTLDPQFLRIEGGPIGPRSDLIALYPRPSIVYDPRSCWIEGDRGWDRGWSNWIALDRIRPSILKNRGSSVECRAAFGSSTSAFAASLRRIEAKGTSRSTPATCL